MPLRAAARMLVLAVFALGLMLLPDFANAYQDENTAGAVGIATGTYVWEATVDISAARVTAPDQTYAGAALTPAPMVALNGRTLAAGTDYDVSYSSNVNVGTATVIVMGKGNYTGTVKAKFTIKKA